MRAHKSVGYRFNICILYTKPHRPYFLLVFEKAVPIGSPITYPMLEKSVYFQISIRLGFLTSKNVHMPSIISEDSKTISPTHHA